MTKPNVDDFTVPEKILLAAEQLEQQGQTPFTAEMLTVAVWKRRKIGDVPAAAAALEYPPVAPQAKGPWVGLTPIILIN